jgi:hypothetical protein
MDEAKKSNDHCGCRVKPLPKGSKRSEQIGAAIYANGPMLRMTHYEGDGSPTFVFDMMEPERPKVDLAVLSQIGGVASGGFHDKGGWGREAQSGVGSTCCRGGITALFQRGLRSLRI